ncbi:hypothetical protein jhhlp_003291 [Lomentospora prolificans]|uniref:UspA domain-containing protein n=1 Tax=Lomentospora prolificans TaxID=41688 RepID=A0A2N3NGD0_9PEZI|nr:hypothetical protein jhhlp_003291 [Lomentospora prolificans]
MSHHTMSLEAAMDEERLAILEILERQAAAKAAPQTARRSASPMTSPRSPIRSMLDVGHETSPARKGTPPPVKYRSMLDVSGPPAPKTQAPVRSLLGPDNPPPSPGYSPSVRSSISEATNATNNSAGPATGSSLRSDSETRRLSDAARRHASPQRGTLSEYQFSDIITSQIGQSLPLPKRNQQGGRAITSPLSQVSTPNPNLAQGHEPLRHSISGPNPRRGNQSRSPHSQRSIRGQSPQPSISEKPKSKAAMAMLDSGYELDLTKAYKNLSDASLLASEGPLAHLALQKAAMQEDGEGPLIKAYLGPDGERLDDTSSDEEPHSDADDEEEEDHRGRNTAPRIVYGSESEHRDSMSSEPGREPKSLLAAAEEERKHLSSVYRVRSLFDDDEDAKKSNSTGNERSRHGGRLSASKERIGPASTVNSANNSENEIERDEIRKAQEMSVKLTDVFSTPETNRSVRVIYRGEFTKVVAAAMEEHKKLRKYLVATDLSDHSAHALEWAVGTVLRDGDTLVATCCLSDEGDDDNKDGASLNPPATQHRASSISLLTSALSGRDSVNGGNGSSGGGDSASNVSTSSAKEQDRLEAERQQVVEEITAKVSKLLRRTKLQVRVIVEVLHCKNPKHLVLEMIDLIKPTLVILGSRGRSSIKGVILGSFSNYLVTKSSVPVMVARKRLRKKTRRGPMKQVNNLSNPAGRSLASAKID